LCYIKQKKDIIDNQKASNPSKGLKIPSEFRGGAKLRTGLGAKHCFLSMKIIIFS
jgi:hypothetical protein